MSCQKQTRGPRYDKSEVIHPRRRVHAIGTWRNLYGTGMRPPVELLCKRGLRVTGKKQPKK